jgi:arylsulfatase A-like enzyme
LQLYNLPGFLGSSRDDWKEIWRIHVGFVGRVDHCIGKIVAALKAEGIYRSTALKGSEPSAPC